jgi:hypothetical protein
MSIITDERPPEEVEEKLAEYLVRMFRDARLADDQHDMFKVRTAVPDKAKVGRLYYFGEPIASANIAYEGFYVYKSDGRWWALADLACGEAWEDNLSNLTAAKASGGGSITTMAINGSSYDQVPQMNGTPAVKLLVEFHVLHDISQTANYYPHIHFVNDTALTAGQTVQFTFTYQAAAGHQQAQFPAATSHVITFTVPAGGLAQWTHCIAESATGLAAEEVDSLILADVQLTGGTYSGNIGGLFVDLHYQRERICTVEKAPDFYT